MKLDELEKLADEADTDGDWYDHSDEYSAITVLTKKDQRFIVAADPQTIKRLISLTRLLHKAVIDAEDWIGSSDYGNAKLRCEALAAFTEFEKSCYRQELV